MTLRPATATQWATLNPVLPATDVGVESDTGFTKQGDGATAWNSLLYQPIIGPEWGPADSGYLAWTSDPVANFQGFALVNTVISVTAVKIPVDMTVTNIVYDVYAAGTATLTNGGCFVGLYQGGTLKAASVSQHTNFASTGVKTAALTSAQSVKRGYAYVAFLPNGSGNAPQLGCAIANIAGVGNATFPTFNGLPRSGFINAVNSTLPSSLGTVTAGRSAWAALS
jgi:hypothetical protein